MTKANIQGLAIKNPRVEEPKARAPESLALPRSNNLESSAKSQWENKKNRRRQKQQDRRDQEGSTLAIVVNASKPGRANKKKNNDKNHDRNRNQNCFDRTAPDMSKT